MYKYICYVGREVVVETSVGLEDAQVEALAKSQFLLSLLDTTNQTPLSVEITDEIHVSSAVPDNE